MLYIMRNVCIINSFKKPLTINSMIIKIKKKQYGLLSRTLMFEIHKKGITFDPVSVWHLFALQPPSDKYPNTPLLQTVIELVDDGYKI